MGFQFGNEVFIEVIRGRNDGIREAGFVLALDDYVGDPSFDPILPYVTYIKVDFLALAGDPARLGAVVDRCLALGKTVLAEKVETEADIAWCRDRGVPAIASATDRESAMGQVLLACAHCAVEPLVRLDAGLPL